MIIDPVQLGGEKAQTFQETSGAGRRLNLSRGGGVGGKTQAFQENGEVRPCTSEPSQPRFAAHSNRDLQRFHDRKAKHLNFFHVTVWALHW